MMTAVNDHELEVLIVEDEGESLEEMAQYLEGAGYVCHTASDAETAFRIAHANPDIGVVVTDIRMPGIDGLELIDRLKGKTVPGQEVEFVVATGFGGHDEMMRSVALQVFDFLEKPVDLKQLSDVVWRARETALSKRLEHDHSLRERKKPPRGQDSLENALHALQQTSKTLASHDAEILTERNRFREFLDILRWGLKDRIQVIQSDEDVGSDLGIHLGKLLALVGTISDPASREDRISALENGLFSIRGLLQKVVSSAEVIAKRHGVKVLYQPSPNRDLVRGRPQLVAKAIHNVLANAIDYTPRYHEIRIGIEHSKDTVTIIVADEGTGMSAEAINVALSPLQSVTRPFGRSRKGLGLGLTTSRLIFELHDGDIDLSSSPGAGTTVKMTLPIAN